MTTARDGIVIARVNLIVGKRRISLFYTIYSFQPINLVCISILLLCYIHVMLMQIFSLFQHVIERNKHAYSPNHDVVFEIIHEVGFIFVSSSGESHCVGVYRFDFGFGWFVSAFVSLSDERLREGLEATGEVCLCWQRFVRLLDYDDRISQRCCVDIF